MSDTYVPADLRRLVRERAAFRCEYCLLPEAIAFLSHEFDHVVAEKHGGQTIEANLALSCALCNKHKGSDIASIDPASGDIVRLFHPRRDHWSYHFQMVGAKIEPLTPEARVTIRLLHLNDPDRMNERKILLSAGLLLPPLT